MRPRIFDHLFKDDRMFVMEISRVSTRELTSSEPAQEKWAVITRRNVEGYPPFRSDTFDTREEAIEYYKSVIVDTPRVSTSERTPNPVPSLEEYQEWLQKERLYDPVLNPKVSEKDA